MYESARCSLGKRHTMNSVWFVLCFDDSVFVLPGVCYFSFNICQFPSCGLKRNVTAGQTPAFNIHCGIGVGRGGAVRQASAIQSCEPQQSIHSRLACHVYDVGFDFGGATTWDVVLCVFWGRGRVGLARTNVGLLRGLRGDSHDASLLTRTRSRFIWDRTGTIRLA